MGVIERKIMQMLLSAVGTMKVHRGWKIIADDVIAFLRTQYKRKSCHVKQDPQVSPSRRYWGRKGKQTLLVLFFFFEGWYSKIGNLGAH